jgi:hypothetical protein
MKKSIKKIREDDQFFTKPEVSKKYIAITEKYVDLIKSSLVAHFYIEPSAGNGDFYNNLKGRKMAFDIEKPINT